MSSETELFTIEGKIPKGFIVKKSDIEGYGVFSENSYKEGDFLYEYRYQIVDQKLITDRYILKLEDHEGNVCSYFNYKDIHPGPITEDLMAVYDFDGFINHKCGSESNAYDVRNQDDPTKYKMYASRDIEAGEELSCNYLNLYYGLETKHSLMKCLCDSKICYGELYGFRFLELEEKVKLLKYVDKIYFKHDPTLLQYC